MLLRIPIRLKQPWSVRFASTSSVLDILVRLNLSLKIPNLRTVCKSNQVKVGSINLWNSYRLLISLLDGFLPFVRLFSLCPFVRHVRFSWFSLILFSNSVSLFLSHSTVKLSTVSWFGSSLPAESSTRLSSNVNFTGSAGVVLNKFFPYFTRKHFNDALTCTSPWNLCTRLRVLVSQYFAELCYGTREISPMKSRNNLRSRVVFVSWKKRNKFVIKVWLTLQKPKTQRNYYHKIVYEMCTKNGRVYLIYL